MRVAFCFVFAAILSSPAVPAQAQGIITTVAGSTWIYRGDNISGTSAPLGQMTGLAVDSAGNVYATDSENQIIVKISPSGVLKVVAGNGIAGISGDGGAATSASLSYPNDVTVDTAGNLYIADSGLGRIRKVSTAGIITTVVGSSYGFSGDGGPATSAKLATVYGVVVDGAGNIFVADSTNHRIRKVDTAGIINTIAGTGAAGYSGDGGPAAQASLNRPGGLALDAAGNLYVADRNNDRIRKITPGGTISTVVGGGTSAVQDGVSATSIDLAVPYDVAVAPDGTLFLAASVNQRILKVTNGTIRIIAGSGDQGFSGDGGPATSAELYQPEGVTVDAAGNVYIADSLNNRVRKVGTDGIIRTIAGNGLFKDSGDGASATSASLNSPQAVAIDAQGNFYVSDSFNRRIRKVSTNGVITTLAGTGQPAFSGDGGPAASATMRESYGVAVDASGNILIADTLNDRVRRVTPSGTITTIAGGGACCSPNDGGPATSAYLAPFGLALDAQGSLYVADAFHHRVRKVNTSGIISTFAGNGTEGFSGDGGPATSASLRRPTALAFDASGNLYIADEENHRVRKVTPAGTITTFAGNGTRGFSGDGGPATAASLAYPEGVAVDPFGNVFIGDSSNYIVRRVDLGGTITTVVGRSGFYGFAGDGGPPGSAQLSIPTGLAFDKSGSLYIADSINDRVRKVLVAAPSFVLAPQTLTFTAPAGAPAVSAQQISIGAAVTGLAWSAQATTASGGAWLTISPSAGATPGVISASVNLTGLAIGSYSGTITVQLPLASPSVQTVTVQLTVQAALPPQLAVEPDSLNLEATTTSNPPAQTIRIANVGGGTLNWTASTSTVNGGNWLAVSQSSGSTSAGSPFSLQVNANVAGLPSGVYTGSVLVSSPATNETQTVSVNLLLSQATQSILVSQNGLAFTGVQGGDAIPSQSFGILNTGKGTMNWTATASTLSGGAWLSVSPSSGHSDGNSLQIPEVEVSISVSRLSAGQYSGLIRVDAPNANNSPQYVTVDLTVLPPGSNPGPLVRPTGLIFAARVGSSSPGSQNVRVATAAPGSVEARGGLLTFDGSPWLNAVPNNVVVSPGNNKTITIQPTLGTLGPDIYRAGLTLLFADGSPSQVVNVLFLVVGGSGSAGGLTSRSSYDPDAVTCTPGKLVAVLRTLGTNFSVSAGLPAVLEAQVIDDCANPITAATVVATFTTGDPPLQLNSLRNGTYVGVWRPLKAGAQVGVTITATLPPLTAAEARATGSVAANATAPVLYSGGIVNAATYAKGGAMAPGSIVSVFGLKLASGLNVATTVPLTTVLGNASLLIGDKQMPLFFSSDGQINAQLPFDLTPNSRPNVVIKTRRENSSVDVYGVPETITMAASQPGIFTMNQAGTGQGAIIDTSWRIVDANAPAGAGEYVQIFCTGLGITNPAVTSGTAAPSAEPLARVVSPVTATVGGKAATVQFAGLAPGYVGLYQVNVQIPTGVAPGNAVPLVLTQNGVPSNTVTLAIK